MEYYIASDQGPLGPYTLEQLKERTLKPDELIWRNGLTEWVKADSLEELTEAFSVAVAPPAFNRESFDAANATEPSPTEVSEYIEPDKDCPPTYRWLAIIAFFGIIPCAIVAIIKSVMVTRLWEAGNYERARRESRKVLTWSLISILIGIPLTILYYLSFDKQEIFELLLNQ